MFAAQYSKATATVLKALINARHMGPREFWSEARRSAQPEEAFMVNAVNIIRVLKDS